MTTSAEPGNLALLVVGLSLPSVLLSGCLLVGSRSLGPTWEPVENQFQYGIQVPIPVKPAAETRPIAPEVAWFSTFADLEDGRVSLDEFAVGLALEPGETGAGFFNARHAFGCGASYVLVRQRGATTVPDAEDGVAAFYGYYRLQHKYTRGDSTGFIGLELRYALPARELEGLAGNSAGGVQLMLWWFGY